MSISSSPPSPANSAATTPRARTGVSCRGCNRQLPIRLTDDGERPALWQCLSCDTRFAGVLVAESSAEQLAEVRLASVHLNANELPEVPDAMRQFVKEWAQSKTAHTGDERRASERVPQQLEVVVAPLTEYFSPEGQACRAMVHNLSEGGLGFLSVKPIDAPFVAVLLGGSDGCDGLQLFGRLVRSRPLADRFYESGVQFTFRLGGQLGQ